MVWMRKDFLIWYLILSHYGKFSVQLILCVFKYIYFRNIAMNALLKNGVKAEVFYEFLPQHTFAYEGETLTLFREIKKNRYRIEGIQDSFTTNGVHLPYQFLRGKRCTIMEKNGLDSLMILNHEIVRFQKLKTSGYVTKQWKHKIFGWRLLKVSFIQGRKLITIIFKKDKRVGSVRWM
mgnify:CR=1 FL=1